VTETQVLRSYTSLLALYEAAFYLLIRFIAKENSRTQSMDLEKSTAEPLSWIGVSLLLIFVEF